VVGEQLDPERAQKSASASSGRSERACGLRESSDFVRVQVEVGGFGIGCGLVGARGADDRDDVLVPDHPGERDLGGCGLVRVGDLAERRERAQQLC